MYKEGQIYANEGNQNNEKADPWNSFKNLDLTKQK